MPGYWDDLAMLPQPDEVLTSAVGTAERMLGLLGEEAALVRNKPLGTAATTRRPAASRDARSGARDEAAAAVGTASKGHGRGSQPGPDGSESRDSRRADPGRGSARRGQRRPGRRGPDVEEER